MIKQLLDVKGSWRQRMFIYFMTFLLGLLFVWALDFVVSDIQSMAKPQLENIEKEYLSPNLVQQEKALQRALDQKAEVIRQLTEQRQQLRSSTQSAQVSIKQIDEQQKMLLQHKKELSPSETKFKNNNMLLFQQNQARDQKLSQELIRLTSQQQALSNQLLSINQLLDVQRAPAKDAYEKAYRKQVWIEAAIQIIFLLAVLGLASFLIYRYRKTNYKLPLLAFFVAALLETIGVVHQYFPSEYFKYLLIAALIVIVSKLLLNLVKSAGSTKPDVLLKRYRDAYTYFLCPTCEFPIRRGPMTFLYWTRRSVAKLVARMAEPAQDPVREEPYTCPACSTSLFEECNKCRGVRYSLLPACQHCGVEK